MTVQIKKICITNDPVVSKTSRNRRKHLTSKIAKQTRSAKYVNKLKQMSEDELQRFKSRNVDNVKKWKKLHKQESRISDTKRKTLRRNSGIETVDKLLQQPKSHHRRLKKLSMPKTYRQLENVRQRSRKKMLRLDPSFRNDENKQQKLLKKILRSDPDYKSKDNAKQQSVEKWLRQDAGYKQNENKNQEQMKELLRSDPDNRIKDNKKKTTTVTERAVMSGSCS